MKVLIVGSLPKETTEEGKEIYRNACRDIGKALADKRWRIGIGTDKADTADALVVEGAVKSNRRAQVVAYTRESDEGHARRLSDRSASEPQRLAVTVVDVEGTWVSGRVEQIRESDIVLLIGGNDKTAPAFIVAHLLETPCIPVPGFGGASALQWQRFRDRNDRRDLKLDEMAHVADPWKGSPSATTVLDFAQRYFHSKPYRVEGSGLLRILLAVVLFSALLWGLLFCRTSPERWSVYGILLLSTMLGAAARPLYTRMQGGSGDTPTTFVIRLAVAIIAAFALFLLLLLGAFSISGEAVNWIESLSNGENFVRMAAISSIFGLLAGFATESVVQSLLERLAGATDTSLTHGEGQAHEERN